jgi:hypothetical protein
MSNSFLQAALGSLVGIAAFYLLEAVYYEIKARVLGKQYTDYMDYLEEEEQK